MCQATVYLGDQEVALEVIGLESAEDGVRLVALFEEPKFVSDRILRIDLLKHRVLLEPLEEALTGFRQARGGVLGGESPEVTCGG